MYSKDILETERQCVSSIPGSAPPGVSLTTESLIDLLRGCLAFLVVAAHSYDLSGVLYGISPRWRPFLEASIGRGPDWVIGFFVLSGFCIHLSCLRSGNHYSFRGYMKARMLRIMPLFYLCLLIALGYELFAAYIGVRPPYWQAGVNIAHFIGEITFIQNIFGVFGSYNPSWSLSNEMMYYIVWGLLLSLTISRSRLFLLSGLTALLLSVVTYGVYFFAGKNGRLYALFEVPWGFLVWWLGAFLIENRAWLLRSRALTATAWAWPAILAATMLLNGTGWLPNTASTPILGLIFALALIRMDISQRRIRPTVRRFFSFLGLLSYPLYLVHAPTIMMVASLLLYFHIRMPTELAWLLMVTVAFAAASVVALGFEKPVLAWRRRMLGRGAGARGSTVLAMATHSGK